MEEDRSQRGSSGSLLVIGRAIAVFVLSLTCPAFSDDVTPEAPPTIQPALNKSGESPTLTQDELIKKCADVGDRLSDVKRVWEQTIVSSDAKARQKAFDLLERFLVSAGPDEPDVAIKGLRAKIAKVSKAINIDACLGATTAFQQVLKDAEEKVKWAEGALPMNSDYSWCKSVATFCRTKHRGSFNGIRLVAEPNLGTVVQAGDNQIDVSGFSGLPLLGVATDLKGHWVGLQLHVVSAATVTLDANASAVTEGRLLDAVDRKVKVEFGIGAGFTFIDGAVALGYTWLFFDGASFVPATAATGPNPRTKGSFYFALQPVSIVQKAISAIP
jgi:hypothetical protein